MEIVNNNTRTFHLLYRKMCKGKEKKRKNELDKITAHVL